MEYDEQYLQCWAIFYLQAPSFSLVLQITLVSFLKIIESILCSIIIPQSLDEVNTREWYLHRCFDDLLIRHHNGIASDIYILM